MKVQAENNKLQVISFSLPIMNNEYTNAYKELVIKNNIKLPNFATVQAVLK